MDICYIEQVSKIIGDKWNLLILKELRTCDLHFSELRRRLAPITAKTLTIKLRKLEQAQIIKQTILKEKNQLISYSITPLGAQTFPILDEIKVFGKIYCDNSDIFESKLS